jgi:hypothetical protein
MDKEGRYGVGSHRMEGVAQRLVENVCQTIDRLDQHPGLNACSPYYNASIGCMLLWRISGDGLSL